jgi:hypothetical protein
VGVGLLKIEEPESEVLKIEESESESELLCTDSTALLNLLVVCAVIAEYRQLKMRLFCGGHQWNNVYIKQLCWLKRLNREKRRHTGLLSPNLTD